MPVVETFQVAIVGKNSSKTIDAQWIELSADSGSFVVGPRHCPLVSQLKLASTLTFKNQLGATGTISIPGGLLVVSLNGSATILLWGEEL